MDYTVVFPYSVLLYLICCVHGGHVLQKHIEESKKSDEITGKEKFHEICGKDGDTDVVDKLLCVNAEINDRHLFEGDVIKEESDQGHKRDQNEQSDLTANEERYWPKTTDADGKTIVIIPYAYDDYGGVYGRVTLRTKYAFQEAINEYREKTCIRFQPRQQEHNYIRVINDYGCYGYIGMQNFPQKISLQDKGTSQGCFFKGVAIHEMMHALGWFHEQSRIDRDQYIKIQWDNIMDGKHHNFYSTFTKYLGLEYDIKSIMHYGPYAFSKNGLPTIVGKDSLDLTGIGQRQTFSDLDIAAINKFYCTEGTPAPPIIPVVTLPEQKVVCPFVRKGGLCRFCSLCTYCDEQCNFNSKDVDAHCDYWASLGFCKKELYVDYMSKSCPKACKSAYCEK